MRAEPDTPSAVGRFYVDTLETCAPRIAEAVAAVATAPSGAVAVHCFVGKDRTGIVAAILLDLAGVEREAIVADYALSEGRVGSLVDAWIGEAADDAERVFRERISTAPAGAMTLTLDTLEVEYGGTTGYLRSAGLDAATLGRARARLT
jgi:protein-tyrosine phosphatase